MSVIEAAAMRCRTLADGSLRIECEVEPRHAQAAFSLFGSPGTAMALAALKAPAESPEAPPAHEPQPAGIEAAKPAKRAQGPICKWLVLRCKERAFQAWVGGASEHHAAEWVRKYCNVSSRADIDGNANAEAEFRRRIQGPWSKHCIAAGIAS